MDETCGSLRSRMRTQYRLKHQYLFWRHPIFGICYNNNEVASFLTT